MANADYKGLGVGLEAISMVEPTKAERTEHLEKTARTRELWYLEVVQKKGAVVAHPKERPEKTFMIPRL